MADDTQESEEVVKWRTAYQNEKARNVDSQSKVRDLEIVIARLYRVIDNLMDYSDWRN